MSSSVWDREGDYHFHQVTELYKMPYNQYICRHAVSSCLDVALPTSQQIISGSCVWLCFSKGFKDCPGVLSAFFSEA